MFHTARPILRSLALVALIISLISCKDQGEAGFIGKSKEKERPVEKAKNPLSQDFKRYWYAGKAEITSYDLEQARYGEMRNGSAVLIFVTEPFLADRQVKPDRSGPDDISVLKLNSTKNFLTGIYPYSIMNSSFYPVHDNQHAIKLTASVQEWCGQVFTQLNNRADFDINSFSYFESEGDRSIKLDKTHLENEIWNRIRINPDRLPMGKISIIPSLEYLRLAHKEIKAYEAVAELHVGPEYNMYSINYPALERTLTIRFSNTFPYGIEGWSESSKNGSGPDAKILTTTAKRIKTLMQAYWQENKNTDVFLRDSLGL